MALIITGLHGSGKTLLRKLCNSHPDIKVTEEFMNFMKLNIPYREHVQFLRKNWYTYPLVSTESKLWHFKSGIFLARYLIALQSYRHVLISAADIETVLRHIFPRATVVGDVFNHYVFVLDTLVNVPSLFLVILYRDCRDVAATISRKFRSELSCRQKPFWLEQIATSENVARRWVSAIEMMERYVNKVHTIRYEDLVTDPKRVLTDFGNWLGVDAKGFRHQMIHTNKIGEYKQYLSNREVAEILAVAGPTMERLGYI